MRLLKYSGRVLECYTYLKKALTKRVLVLVKSVNQDKYQDYQPSSGLWKLACLRIPK